jgi:hypothetical protein
MVYQSRDDVLSLFQCVVLCALGLDSVIGHRDVVPWVDLNSLLNDRTLEEGTAESLDVLQGVLALCAGQTLKELRPHERLVPLQRHLAEVLPQVLFPDLFVPAHGRRLLSSLASQLHNLFGVWKVPLLPEIRDGHVLLGRAVRLSRVDGSHDFVTRWLDGFLGAMLGFFLAEPVVLVTVY